MADSCPAITQLSYLSLPFLSHPSCLYGRAARMLLVCLLSYYAVFLLHSRHCYHQAKQSTAMS